MAAKKAGGKGIGNLMRRWMTIVKFWTFPISVVPITVGAAISAGSFKPLLYALMVIGVVCLNFVANMLNDIFDFRYGIDKPSDVAVIRRVHPLISGGSTERQLIWASAILAAIAAACGAYIALHRGFIVIEAGIVGALAAVFYTAGRRSIKSVGLGELLVFLIYGPVITVSAYFVEAGSFSYAAAAASIPVGLVIAMILLANNIRDIKADSSSGLSTLAVRLGARKAKRIFNAMAFWVYGTVVLFSLAGAMPIYSLVTLASVPYAIGISGRVASSQDIPYNSAEQVSRLALVFGILLALGLVL